MEQTNEEKIETLVKHYENKRQVLNGIPAKISKLNTSKALLEEDMGLQNQSLSLQVADMQFKEKHFSIKESQKKFEWEDHEEWKDIQEDMIRNSIAQLQFKIRMNNRKLKENNTAIGAQVAELEKQRDRCIEDHRLDLESLKELKADVNKIKKGCTCKSCR